LEPHIFKEIKTVSFIKVRMILHFYIMRWLFQIHPSYVHF